jgi:hypothetical protein
MKQMDTHEARRQLAEDLTEHACAQSSSDTLGEPW